VAPPSFSVVADGAAFYRSSPIQTALVAYSVFNQAAVGATFLVPTTYRWGDLTGTWGSYTQPWKAFTGRGIYNVAAGAIPAGVVQQSGFSGSCEFLNESILQAILRIGAADVASTQQVTTPGARLALTASASSGVTSGAAANLTSSLHLAGQIASSGVVDAGLISILTAFSSRAGRSSVTWRI
jgi:hypothetical protein